MFKNMLLKKMLKAQGVDDAQIEMALKLMEKNPELFKKIALEIEAEVKSGKEKMTAASEVMQKYQSELKGLL
ncbi:MAG TPA: hypothetical protein VFQ59_02320 [Candidatus Paceibacterota bacterium]|nr:hypothetical protein [Candidatus Paceibacterota bacterium]